jgi:hypothetical protein
VVKPARLPLVFGCCHEPILPRSGRVIASRIGRGFRGVPAV